MKFKRSPSDFQSQGRHLDLGSVENIADSIALLKDENERLRRMVALLSAETEYIRRSLSSSAHWRRLRALP
jgi:hypothetical protein